MSMLIAIVVSVFIFALLRHTVSFAISRSDNRTKALEAKRKAVMRPDLVNSIGKGEPKDDVILSRAGAQIVRDFNSLPEAHRPAYDIKSVVAALDKKYDIHDVNYHFMDYDHHRYSHSHYDPADYFTWDCSCDENSCSFPEYRELVDSMVDIYDAISERRRAEEAREREIELAGIENELRAVKEITAALRMEAESIKEIA